METWRSCPLEGRSTPPSLVSLQCGRDATFCGPVGPLTSLRLVHPSIPPNFSSPAGLWPEVALINHSCAPNSLSVLVGEAMIIRTTRNLRKGEEVTLSYLPGLGAMVPAEERREYLKSNFGFDCKCYRCKVNTVFRSSGSIVPVNTRRCVAILCRWRILSPPRCSGHCSLPLNGSGERTCCSGPGR